MTDREYRDKIVELASRELGKSEPYDDDVYIDFYNDLTHIGFANTVPWCAIFVTWTLRNAGVSTQIVPNFASCTIARDRIFKPKGLWKDNSYLPQKGDLIFFDWSGLQGANGLDHVGIVTGYSTEKAVNGFSKVYTIEGNSKGGYTVDGVRAKSYISSSSFIAGYGTPVYSTIKSSSTISISDSGRKYTANASTFNAAIKKFQSWIKTTYNISVTASGKFSEATRTAAIKALQTELNSFGETLDVDGSFGPKTKAAIISLQKGTTGNLVYLAQGFLYGNGYNPNGFDGIFGNGMRTCVINYQKDMNLAQDGSIGPATWDCLCNH